MYMSPGLNLNDWNMIPFTKHERTNVIKELSSIVVSPQNILMAKAIETAHEVIEWQFLLKYTAILKVWRILLYLIGPLSYK